MGLFWRRYCFFYRLFRGCTGFWVKILFFFFNGRYRFFYRPLRGWAGFQVKILFFFCNGHYCFRYRLLRGCGGFWVKILFLKKMVPQSNSTGYQFSLTRIASGQYISSFSTGSEQQKRWINKDGKLIKVLDITEAYWQTHSLPLRSSLCYNKLKDPN